MIPSTYSQCTYANAKHEFRLPVGGILKLVAYWWSSSLSAVTAALWRKPREKRGTLSGDSRYDLILGMAWFERHEPRIDWRSQHLGATHFSPGGALASHEPASARKQKRFWCEHWTEAAHVLDIGVSELVDTEGVEKECPERGSVTVRGAALNSLSVSAPDGASLRASYGAVGMTSRNCGVAHNPLSGGCGSSRTSLGVGQDIAVLPELNEVATPGVCRDAKSKVSSRWTTTVNRRQRHRALAARRKASELARGENGVSSGGAPRESEQL
ncbi:hypothetical protein ON010_g13146 [Phytophthora cinnamomi]|nr:hypothetical protein ON010_g13146 [Phytophthora cinnamomi]